jgi:hypothetical protein
MLAKDSDLQDRWRQQQKRESDAERRQRQLADELQNHAVTVADDAGHDISNLMAQLGKPLSSQQIIEKLTKCNPRLYFEVSPSDATKVGIYLVDPTGKVYVNPRGEVLTLKHICGMESGISPEFTVIHKTTTKVANQELFGRKEATREVPWKQVETYYDQTRGWRTVLIRLLHAGLINSGDVEKHFGWTPSRDSQRWADQTR